MDGVLQARSAGRERNLRVWGHRVLLLGYTAATHPGRHGAHIRGAPLGGPAGAHLHQRDALQVNHRLRIKG